MMVPVALGGFAVTGRSAYRAGPDPRTVEATRRCVLACSASLGRVAKWQTRTVQVRVPKGVGVQLPPRPLWLRQTMKGPAAGIADRGAFVVHEGALVERPPVRGTPRRQPEYLRARRAAAVAQLVRPDDLEVDVEHAGPDGQPIPRPRPGDHPAAVRLRAPRRPPAGCTQAAICGGRRVQDELPAARPFAAAERGVDVARDVAAGQLARREPWPGRAFSAPSGPPGRSASRRGRGPSRSGTSVRPRSPGGAVRPAAAAATAVPRRSSWAAS